MNESLNELARFKRGPGKCAIVKLDLYKGREYVDIREWVESDGRLIATKKGIKFLLSGVPELIEVLERAVQNGK